MNHIVTQGTKKRHNRREESRKNSDSSLQQDVPKLRKVRSCGDLNEGAAKMSADSPAYHLSVYGDVKGTAADSPAYLPSKGENNTNLDTNEGHKSHFEYSVIGV